MLLAALILSVCALCVLFNINVHIKVRMQQKHYHNSFADHYQKSVLQIFSIFLVDYTKFTLLLPSKLRRRNFGCLKRN